MTKQTEANWVNVTGDTLTGVTGKAWMDLVKAREAFKATMISEARKQKALEPNQTLAFNFKGWGFGMAKVSAKGKTNGNGKDVFASL